MYIEVDLEDLAEVKKFIMSDNFSSFLTSNIVNFSACAFILQSLLDATEEAEKQLSEDKDGE